MTGGFALLGSHLGNPERKILTAPQIRTLTQRMQEMQVSEPNRSLSIEDLQQLGYGPEMAERILGLLEDEAWLTQYLQEGQRQHCRLITREDPDYPALLRKRLGGESPCCLFCKGDVSLLQQPGIALVGSRELQPFNREFAREVGRQAAAHDLILVSGNARGADREAQNACLEAGGRVISIVADSLQEKTPHPRILYVSLEDYDAPFSAQRALSRNRVIHALGYMTFVAQCSLETGGTWSGTTQNLREGWSLVICCRDGSPAALALQNQGAYLMDRQELSHLTDFQPSQLSFL